MIQAEEYNQYGEIIKKDEVKPYQRTMSAYDQHRIHDTKDVYDGDCSYCRLPPPFGCSKCHINCFTRQGLKDHWLLEH